MMDPKAVLERWAYRDNQYPDQNVYQDAALHETRVALDAEIKAHEETKARVAHTAYRLRRIADDVRAISIDVEMIAAPGKT